MYQKVRKTYSVTISSSINLSLFSSFLLPIVVSFLLLSFSLALLFQFQGLLLHIELSPCRLHLFRFIQSTCMPFFHCNQKMRWGMANSATFIPKYADCLGSLTVPLYWRYWRVRNIARVIRNGFVSNVSPFDWYGLSSDCTGRGP